MAAKKKAAPKKKAAKKATGDLIISKSRVKAATKKCNVGGDFYGALDAHVRKIIAGAEERATANKRKTLKPADIYSHAPNARGPADHGPRALLHFGSPAPSVACDRYVARSDQAGCALPSAATRHGVHTSTSGATSRSALRGGICTDSSATASFPRESSASISC